MKVYGNPKGAAAAGTTKTKTRKRKAGSALARKIEGGAPVPGKRYKLGADGRLHAIKVAKRRNPSDFGAMAKSLIKVDGPAILEGAAIFLIGKFLWSKYLAAKVQNPSIHRFADFLIGVAGGAVELYRGKREAAVVCLSAGVVSAAATALASHLAGGTMGAEGSDFYDLDDYEIRDSAAMLGDDFENAAAAVESYASGFEGEDDADPGLSVEWTEERDEEY